jgi:hypothetical protein
LLARTSLAHRAAEQIGPDGKMAASAAVESLSSETIVAAQEVLIRQTYQARKQ